MKVIGQAKIGTKVTRMLKKNFFVFLLWLLSKKEMTGYDVIKTLSKEKEARGVVSAAVVYPALSSLLKAGLIRQKTVKAGRRIKKFYKTTEKGMREIKQFKDVFLTGLTRQFLEEMLR
ncbi:MAG: PadR family transcriptional regulator [Candidatus Bilamarchaeaceae archaeon]